MKKYHLALINDFLTQCQGHLELYLCSPAVAPVALEENRVAPQHLPEVHYHVQPPRGGLSRPFLPHRIHGLVASQFYFLVCGQEIVVGNQIRQACYLAAIIAFLHFRDIISLTIENRELPLIFRSANLQ